MKQNRKLISNKNQKKLLKNISIQAKMSTVWLLLVLTTLPVLMEVNGLTAGPVLTVVVVVVRVVVVTIVVVTVVVLVVVAL